MYQPNHSAMLIFDRTIFQKKVEVQHAGTLHLISQITKILGIKCETEIEEDGTVIATLTYLKGNLTRKESIKNLTRINVALNIIETKQKCLM
ncbi:MAG: hypothetical protein ACW98K_04335 [Candidatus Kariarchaeaceae archaeon]|jgi:hypothetical protein